MLKLLHVFGPDGFNFGCRGAGKNHLAGIIHPNQQFEMVALHKESAVCGKVVVGINHIAEVDLFVPYLPQRLFAQVDSVAKHILIARMLGSGNAARSEAEAAVFHLRMAVNFKGIQSSAAGSDFCSLEKADGGIEIHLPHILQVRGRRQHQYGGCNSSKVLPSGRI